MNVDPCKDALCPASDPKFHRADLKFPTRWGPRTTISGFIPSYTHLQPWLIRVCWGYNYLITRGAPSCMISRNPAPPTSLARRRHQTGRCHTNGTQKLFEEMATNRTGKTTTKTNNSVFR